MLPGGLVADFGELADQLLEHPAHGGVVHGLRVQVDVRELLGDQIEQVGLGQPLDLRVEVEALEDVPGRGGEALEVGVQVLPDVVLVAQKLAEVERTRVVEALTGLAQQEGVGVQAGAGFGLVLGQHRGLRGFEHAVQPAKDREGQDDAAVLGLLVVAAQQVGDGPDEGRERLVIHSSLVVWPAGSAPFADSMAGAATATVQ